MNRTTSLQPLEWIIRPAAGRTWTESVDLDRSARVWGAIKAVAASDRRPPSLTHAVQACAQAMSAFGATFAMTRSSGVWEPLLSSSTEAGELDELQFTLGEGPSGDAVRTGVPILESDLAGLGAGHRWPTFAAAATERGIRAAFALPVGVGAARVGVLTIYRQVSGPLATELLQDALVFADAVLVLALDERIGIDSDADQLIAAAFTARRAEVHQAVGMVAAQHGISVTDALARLRAHAYSSGRSLHHVATEVLSGHLRLEVDQTINRTSEPKEPGSQHAEEEDS